MSKTLCAIACFNEELAIGSMALQAKRYVDEVLVVDDGSTDRTAEIARLAGAQVIVHTENSGKGRAVQNSFRYARDNGFDVLVLMDGDGQHDPQEIPLLLKPILAGKDMAIGFRFGHRSEMPTWRRAGKRVLDYATAAGTGAAVTDSQCGYRAFGRNAIREMAAQLKGTGFGTEAEQLVIAAHGNFVLEEIHVSCRYEGVAGSTKGPIALATSIMLGLVEAVARRRPLLFVGAPSMLVILAAVVLGVFTLQSYNRLHVLSLSLALLTATLAILGMFGAFSALILNRLRSVERRLPREGHSGRLE